ncbi:MAG: DUF4145 domain-containing protein [Methylococcales bacterium]|nr:DUF4145 domain-containing protein [Methylococcales bacterium]
MAQNWTCPYCNRHCTVGDDNVKTLRGINYISETYGAYRADTQVITCPNPECQKQTISLGIYQIDSTAQYHNVIKKLHYWNLLPESMAKPFPDYIPQQIRNDYNEACLIRDKSPKASATLSRRCLQGIIRDFWDIRESRLIDEIKALEDKVDANTWTAIDSVRHIGNIGAHMEKDVNVIIDVEPEEAGLLIELIETLFTEWYVQRYERKQRMDKIVGLATQKKEEKKNLNLANSEKP